MTDPTIHRSQAGGPVWGDATPYVVEETAFPFWQVVILGIATVLFGIAVLAWPDATVRALAVLVGIWLIIAGAARILGAFVSGRGFGRQVLSGIVGVLLLVGGAACLRDIAKGVFVLAWIIGLAWILGGLTELVIAAQATGATRTWLIVLAVISIAIGIAFMVWPDLSLATMVLLTGVGALVIGLGEIVLAFQLRRSTATP